jgi:hypothetical protein
MNITKKKIHSSYSENNNFFYNNIWKPNFHSNSSTLKYLRYNKIQK